MPDFTGQSLGRYHILEKLGEGGMAVVYKAYDTHLECDVAVKVIRLDNSPRNAEERALKRFEREAKEVARLNHPNIVKVTDYGEYEGSPYLVMPYLPGGTLKQLITEHGQLPWQEAARLLIPIAEALSYAHSEGVIHRDVKPSNILLTRSGQPMLTDFGVAKIIDEEVTQDLTGTSATVGTPEYMAPEQVISKTVDHRVDIYALGVVFFELITGRRPYEADTPMAVLVKHASEPLPRPSQFVKNLPQKVEHFLIKILTKNPEDRYQSADEVVNALTVLLTNVEIPKAIPEEKKEVQKKPVIVPMIENKVKKRFLVRWISAMLGVMVLIGIGIGLADLLSRDSTKEQFTETILPKPVLVETQKITTNQSLISTPTEEFLVTSPITINLWTKEGEADGGLQYVQALADAYTAAHPNVTFVVTNKEVETLREDFQTASLANAAPELLWTVSDHLGPFTTADLIQPVDKLVDLSLYVDSATKAVQSPDGQTWGVPISNGNHLMLLFNKSLVETAPATTDDLMSWGADFLAANPGKYPLVFNQTEAFWFVPWLGGFNGKVFATDGVTPTLNTPEMIATFAFLAEVKAAGLIPAESDYDVSDTMFKEGNAAMIINGDWSLGGYKEALGDNLGVAPIPQVSATGTYPAPYTSGVFFMIPKGLEGDKLNAVIDFIKFATDKDNQVDMVSKLTRLPALKTALEDPIITGDPILSGSAAQMSYGTPMPTVVEMRCVWDAIKPELLPAFNGSESAAKGAENTQKSALACINNLN